jgi:hypothetical protein
MVWRDPTPACMHVDFLPMTRVFIGPGIVGIRSLFILYNTMSIPMCGGFIASRDRRRVMSSSGRFV